MYTEMNREKEVPIPPQVPSLGSWMEIPVQKISHTGLLLSVLGNSLAPGESSWPQFDTTGVYQPPVETQSLNSSASSYHSFNQGDQIEVPVSASNVYSTNNQSIGSDCMVMKRINGDDGLSWEDTISLMRKPSSSSTSFPVNGMGNGSVRTKSTVISAPYSTSPSYSNFGLQTPIKGPHELGGSRMVASMGALMEPVSHSQAWESFKQSATESAQLESDLTCHNSHYYANRHEKPNLYYEEGSNLTPANVTCNMHQSQTFYPASDNVYSSTAFPDFLPDGFPVAYQARSYYTHNYSVSSTSGSTNSSNFAPPTPDPASNSGVQHNPRVQPFLPMASYPSFVPSDPPVANNLEHLQASAGFYLPLDRSKNQASTQPQNLPVPPTNDLVQHVCQETTGDIMNHPTAIGTPQTEKDISETGEGPTIDLNKTPPQKTPKRRKHRPKVIREKKPSKSKKPSTPKVGPDGAKVAKRKYVRKNKPAETPLPETAEVGEASNMEPASKSCRRSLNFDLENDGLDQIQRAADINCLEEAEQQILYSVPQKQQQVPIFRLPSGSATCQSSTGQEIHGAPSTSSISSLLLCQENFQNKRKKLDSGYRSNVREIQSSTIHAAPYKNQSTGHTLDHFTQEELLNSSLDIHFTEDELLNPSLEVDINRSPASKLLNSSLEIHFTKDKLLNPSLNVDINIGPGSGVSSSINEWQSYSSYAQRQQTSSRVVAWPGKTSASGENQSASSAAFRFTHGRTERVVQAQRPVNGAWSPKRTGKSTASRTTSSSMLVTHRAPAVPIIQSQSTALDKKQMSMVSVEDIVELLGCLNLSATSNEILQHNMGALVPYKADGSIVPYEKFEALKKRKARPKVDLDQETNRLWNVLMGKVITEDEKKTDEEKAKWWEEERRVFRGRADSFIARMHLVQGDRRFSPWKGSVVDSVIGVFLTQNVTDHVSSSAFMSLAARFPFQSTRNSDTSLGDGLSVIIQEPDETIEEPSRQLNQEIQHLADAKSWRLEEVISSQDSAESSNLQATGGIQSFAESTSRDYQVNDEKSYNKHQTTSFNLEVNDTVRLLDSTIQVTGNLYSEASTKGYVPYQSATGSSEMKQMDGPNITNPVTTSHNLLDLNWPYWQPQSISSSTSQIPLAGSSGSCSTGILGMQNLKYSLSMDSSASRLTLVEDTGTTSEPIGQELQGGTVLLHNRPVKANYPPSYNPCPLPDMQSVETRNIMQTGLYSRQNFGEDQCKTNNLSCHSTKVAEALHTNLKMSQTSISVHDYPRPTAHVDESIMMIENRVQEEREIEASNFREQICSSTEDSNKIKKYEQKSRNGGSESKRFAFDWDILRKQAQATSNQKERSIETADSMDYETLRHADVKDISQAIRERGMNNMLAERMKNFLNRVAQDHGSVDLEWLRDVPPEKAKDYLLSIRGLGLKSVECVRLLTLHQHAFPVDTNVGRIAVRLGWVPLQPLPESLQLHLLEMYPVLESIQKYLWPRLCNLDQRTLYELHYQLITFGKVFCTKSKPNCNACPMRGECRHFASAFASSRLALPGPEDKSIVTSDVPINAARVTPIAVSPVPLQSLEGIPYQVAKTEQRCEPIVEEPSTPEPENTETPETDIEDVYEDTDEIPTIRLNVEEFAVNLQNFMQGNMELLEGDMSKALVALDPNAASIPTPKLKNVSRLRTEHQVYQLPDSHPLLKELEVREPDDPSPYLLAIWTPGETADSIQPPEGRCSSQELGRLCSENTCFTCNSIREGNAQTVRGTLLIPCRTATRGSFPLNGTYFQVNEVFADHESSLNPINVPRSWIWNLQRRTVYFGTSATTIFKGMSTEDIQYCFWRGFVCVRGFDRESRAPRPLMARLHFPASKRGQPTKEDSNNNSAI